MVRDGGTWVRHTVQPWFVCWRETFDRGPGPRFKNLELNSQTTTLKERKKRFEKEGDGLTFPNSYFHMKIHRLVVKLRILTGAPVIRLPANELSRVGVYVQCGRSIYTYYRCILSPHPNHAS